MRISDWSSDVCSSDLGYAIDIHPRGKGVGTEGETGERHIPTIALPLDHHLVRVDIAGVGQHLFRRNDIVEVGVAMFVIVEVIEGTARSAAAAIVDLEHHIAVIDEILRSEEHTSELQSLMRISYAV